MALKSAPEAECLLVWIQAWAWVEGSLGLSEAFHQLSSQFELCNLGVWAFASWDREQARRQRQHSKVSFGTFFVNSAEGPKNAEHPQDEQHTRPQT